MKYADMYSTKQTPQSEPMPGQALNSAGGHAWAVDDWTRLDRFLVLGSDAPTYYASARQLTRENAQAVERCIADDGVRAVRRIAEISDLGRAPKNDPAIFALAMAAKLGDAATRDAALRAVPRVCRIGTHLFQFAAAVEAVGGWGRGTRKAVASWYTVKSADVLAYQLAKYQQRGGWSHRDILRLSHPKHHQHHALIRWALGKAEPEHPLLAAMAEAKDAKPARVAELIREHGLTREMVPTSALASATVWEALLDKMPMTAMLRNLGTMSKAGLFGPMSTASTTVASRLASAQQLRKARIHPLSVLVALRTYAQGRGVRGSGEWDVNRAIVDALDATFYASFGNVESTGKRTLLALDVSGSMTWAEIAGMAGITPRVGSAAMALVTAAVEASGRWACVGFSDTLRPIDISPRQRLDDAIRAIERLQMGGTDCSLPMLWAEANAVEVDTFIVYTDSETWAGHMHPKQALDRYRQRTGLNAKLVVVGMVSNGFSIADPNDAGMLDVVGFDTATPNVMAEFARD